MNHDSEREEPCSICGVAHIPNAKTIAAIEEARAGGMKTYSSIEDLLKEIEQEDDDSSEKK